MDPDDVKTIPAEGSTSDKDEVVDEKLVVFDPSADPDKAEEEKPEETKEEVKPEVEDDDFEDLIPEGSQAASELIKEIKAKAPDLLKDIPHLRDVIFRAQAHSAIFDSVDDAKNARDTAQVYADLETEVLDGQIEPLLESVKIQDPEALGRLAENFLPSLYKQSPEAFRSITDRVIGNTLNLIYRAAERRGDDNLKNAVKAINKEINNTDQVPEFRVLGSPRDDSTRLDRERKQLEAERFSTAKEAVSSAIGPELDRVIETELKRFSGLSEDQRELIESKSRRALKEALKGDDAFIEANQRAWDAAKSQRYGEKARARIANAYLARARPILAKAVRQLGVSYAKKGAPATKVDLPAARPQAGVTSKLPPKEKIDMTRTSTRDLLDGKVMLR